MTLADQTIYLASKSPRRRELLQQVGVRFEVLELIEEPGSHGAVSEIPFEREVPDNYVVRVAREKADSGWAAVLWRDLPRRPVLAADTTVTIDGQILGKPANHEEAMQMLQLLSGRTHQVLTAVAVRIEDQINEALHRSEVRFAALSEKPCVPTATCPSLMTKPAAMVSRDTQRNSLNISVAAIQASWDCRYLKPPDC